MLIRFDLGDWSWDGHRVSVCFVVESNRSTQQIADAYHRACRETGLVLHDRVCGRYEDHAIRTEDLNLLRQLGYVPSESFNPEYVEIEDIFAMFVTMVRHGDPEIIIEEVKADSFFIPGTPDRSFHLGYGALS